jgi:hypothetical protein
MNWSCSTGTGKEKSKLFWKGKLFEDEMKYGMVILKWFLNKYTDKI